MKIEGKPWKYLKDTEPGETFSYGGYLYVRCFWYVDDALEVFNLHEDKAGVLSPMEKVIPCKVKIVPDE